MTANNARERIVRRVAQELKKGDLVNLGIGMPTLVANYVPEELGIIFQAENGMVGIGAAPTEDNIDPDLTNAGGQPVTAVAGAAFFDTSLSFSIIRGGHVDVTVLGALEVDSKGNLANWIIPGKLVPGMGGAMDLVSGARRVIIAMEHCDKKGQAKILNKCTLPLTAVSKVNLIITELAVIEVREDGLWLREIAADTSLKDVIEKTKATLNVVNDLKRF